MALAEITKDLLTRFKPDFHLTLWTKHTSDQASASEMGNFPSMHIRGHTCSAVYATKKQEKRNSRLKKEDNSLTAHYLRKNLVLQ